MSDDADAFAVSGQNIAAVPLHKWLGFQVVERGGPKAVVTLDLTDEVRGPVAGTIHGGILATLADVTSAFTLWGAYEYPAELPVTTDMHIRYYRQPKAGPINATGQLVHRGRRLLSVECSISDGDDRVLARATATYMVVPVSKT